MRTQPKMIARDLNNMRCRHPRLVQNHENLIERGFELLCRISRERPIKRHPIKPRQKHEPINLKPRRHPLIRIEVFHCLWNDRALLHVRLPLQNIKLTNQHLQRPKIPKPLIAKPSSAPPHIPQTQSTKPQPHAMPHLPVNAARQRNIAPQICTQTPKMPHPRCRVDFRVDAGSPAENQAQPKALHPCPPSENSADPSPAFQNHTPSWGQLHIGAKSCTNAICRSALRQMAAQSPIYRGSSFFAWSKMSPKVGSTMEIKFSAEVSSIVVSRCFVGTE